MGVSSKIYLVGNHVQALCSIVKPDFHSIENHPAGYYSRMMDYLWAQFGDVRQREIAIGIHAMRIIDDYVFFYENGKPIISYHRTRDKWDLRNALKIVLAHSSAMTTEEIDIHDGLILSYWGGDLLTI